MINTSQGEVNIDGIEIEVMADLAVIIRVLLNLEKENGFHPVMAALRILKYVMIGLTYRKKE